jgi:hypothetical protein
MEQDKVTTIMAYENPGLLCSVEEVFVIPSLLEREVAHRDDIVSGRTEQVGSWSATL